MLAIFMTLIRTARQAEAGDTSSNERSPASSDVMGAGFSDAEALLLRLGLPREFIA